MTIEPSPAAKELSDTINCNRENIVGGYDNGRNQRELVQEHLDAYAEAHKSANDALVEENVRLREALEFYADDSKRGLKPFGTFMGGQIFADPLLRDNGKIAKEALSPQQAHEVTK